LNLSFYRIFIYFIRYLDSVALFGKNKSIIGHLEIELIYLLSLEKCERLINTQTTELEYSCKKPKLELEAINRDIKSIINTFPEIHFDDYDSCFYISTEDQLANEYTRKGELGENRKRDCNNCCVIF